MENRDIDFIQKVFDNRYRKVDDCNDLVAEQDRRQDKLEIRFAEGVTKLNVLIGILSTISIPIVGMCVKYLFKG